MIEPLGIIAKKQTESNQARVIAEPAGSMAIDFNRIFGYWFSLGDICRLH